MPHAIAIDVRRSWWSPWRRNYRRDLPASWKEVPESRRLPLLRLLLRYPGEYGRLKALESLLNLPKGIFFGLDESQHLALQQVVPWMEVKPGPFPIFDYFRHKGIRYLLPAPHGLNLVAIEYPIADEQFEKYVATGDIDALRMLAATICRELDPDPESVGRRGDLRVALLNRFQAEERAKVFADLPEEVLTGVVMYFAGVKQYVHKAYGRALFEQPEDGEEQTEKSTTPTLGWWSIYFQIGENGPFGDVERVYQTQFHDVCLYLVDKRWKELQQKMQERLKANDFGNPNPT